MGYVSAPAQTTTNAATASNLPPPILDNDEMAKLSSVRNQVLAAHPDLKSEEEKLKALHDSMQKESPAPTRRSAMRSSRSGRRTKNRCGRKR